MSKKQASVSLIVVVNHSECPSVAVSRSMVTNGRLSNWLGVESWWMAPHRVCWVLPRWAGYTPGLGSDFGQTVFSIDSFYMYYVFLHIYTYTYTSVYTYFCVFLCLLFHFWGHDYPLPWTHSRPTDLFQRIFISLKVTPSMRRSPRCCHLMISGGHQQREGIHRCPRCLRFAWRFPGKVGMMMALGAAADLVKHRLNRWTMRAGGHSEGKQHLIINGWCNMMKQLGELGGPEFVGQLEFY